MVATSFFVVVVTLVVSGFVVGAVGTRRVAGDTVEFASRFRQLMAVWGATTLVAFVAVSVTSGMPAEIAAAMPSFVPTPLGLTVGWLLVVPLAVTATTSAYFAGFPSLAAVRDSDLDRRTATLAFARSTAVHLGLLGLPAAVAMAAVSTGWGYLAVGVTVATIPLLSYVAGPLVASLSVSTRDPEPAEKRRLDEVATIVDLPEVTSHVVDGAFGTDSGMAIVGPPGFRRLYVSSSAFESPAAFRSALATLGGRERVSFRSKAAGLLSLKVLVGVSLIVYLLELLPVERSPPVALGALAAGGLLVLAADWFCWRLVYRSDRYAARRLGTDELIDGLDALAERTDADRNPSRLVQHVRMQPSLSRRIARLTERK